MLKNILFIYKKVLFKFHIAKMQRRTALIFTYKSGLVCIMNTLQVCVELNNS